MRKRIKRSISILLVFALCMTQNVNAVFADEFIEDKEAAAVDEEPAGEVDLFEELVNSVSVSRIEVTPGSYNARIGIDSTASEDALKEFAEAEGKNAQVKWEIVYKEGEDGDLSFEDGVSTESEIDASGWKSAGLGYAMQAKSGGSWNQSPMYNFRGRVIAENILWEGLKPGSTYSYYIVLKNLKDETGRVYLFDGKKTFTTEDPVTETSIQKIKLEQKKEIFERTVLVTVNNPENEDVEGFYYGPEGFVNGTGSVSVAQIKLEENRKYITEAGTRYDDEYDDEDPADDSYEYYDSTLSRSLDITGRDHLYLLTYGGDGSNGSVIKAVDMGKVDTDGPAPLSADSVSVSYEPGIASIKATITYESGDYDLDTDGLVVMISANETGDNKNAFFSNMEDARMIKWERDGDTYRATVVLTGFGDMESDERVFIGPDTQYGLTAYVGKTDPVYEYVWHAVLAEQTVRTLEDTQIPSSDFDGNFLGFLHNKYDLDTSGDTVSQSALDRITEIEGSYTGNPMRSIRGIKYLRNLKSIELNKSHILDISELAENDSVESAVFLENSLTTLPDLSGMASLTNLELYWNYIPDSEITVSKLPASLDYEYYDGYQTVSRTREEVAQEIKENQHRDSDVSYETRYRYDDSGRYPVSVKVKKGTLQPFKLPGKGNNRIFYYLLKAYTDNEPDIFDVCDAVKRVAIVVVPKGDTTDSQAEAIEEIKEKYSLDEVFDSRGGGYFDFDVKSVSGINAPGTHSVTMKLYRVNEIEGESSHSSSWIEIWSKTAQITHTKEEVIPEPEPEPGPEPGPAPDSKSHTVTFVSGNVIIDKQSVSEGQTARKPEAVPSLPEHIFIGWGVGESLYDFTTPVYSDLTLTALFKKSRTGVSENSGSGMDGLAGADLDTSGEVIKGSIYLVKGQTYTIDNPGRDWKSEDKKTAKVSRSSGKITAQKAGKTKVRNATHELDVYVAEPKLAVRKVAGKDAKDTKPRNVEMLVGETAEFKVDGIDEALAGKYPVTWYSTKTEVAAVNDGIVTAVGKGTAKISAFVGGKEYRGEVKVSDRIKDPSRITSEEAEIDVNALKTVSLKVKSFSIGNQTWESVGDSQKLEVSKRDGKNNPVEWENDIVRITNRGKLTGIGQGTTKIKGVTPNGGNVILTVNVKAINGKSSVFVAKGKQTKLSYMSVKRSNALWRSLDTTKITVSNGKDGGTIKGVDFGSSLVTCSVNDTRGLVFETMAYCQDPKLKKDSEGKISIDDKGTTGTLELDPGDVYLIETSGISGVPFFKAGNKRAAFVDENGVIYARKKGKANITTKVCGRTLKIKLTVR